MTSFPGIALPASVEELLAQMVAVETVNPLFGGPEGGEVALAEHLEKLAQAWGLTTRRCPVDERRFNLLITHEISDSAGWLMFESHLDTVSVAGMTIAPFALKREDGRLYGRGTCDTKGSGAAMFWALQAQARSGRATHNLAMVFAIDEEARMTGARTFAANELKPFLTRLRGVIVGEPTMLTPVVAHNGVVRWRSITTGVAAHSSQPSQGRSAISAMLRVVDALESRYVPTVTGKHPLAGSAAMSVNVIRGGSQVNIIPARCEIECDRRTVPGETAEQIFAEREAVLAGLEVKHDMPYVVPAMSDELGRDFYVWLAPIMERQGLPSKAAGAPYVTDASYYSAAGAPTIVLGPGALAQAHTKDEWVAVDQLDKATALYAAMMAG